MIIHDWLAMEIQLDNGFFNISDENKSLYQGVTEEYKRIASQ